MLFLAINMGLLYYIIFFGHVASLSHSVRLLESRVNMVLDPVKESDEPAVVANESLVVLSEQQEQKLLAEVVDRIDDQLGAMVEQELLKQEKELNEEAEETSVSTVVKEYFIPIGDAVVKTGDNNWKDVPVQVEVNTSNYPQISEAYFEATMRIPTGNGQVQARLVDTQTGTVVGSEITGEGVDGVFVKSGTLNLGIGKRTFKVQMKTTLDFEGILENARLRLISK